MKRLLVLNIILIMVLLSGTAALALEGEAQIISSVAVEGNQKIHDQEILSVIKTASGDEFNEEKLKADLQHIADLGYFQDVSVHFTIENKGLKAIFEVVEYPVIAEIVIEGNEVYEDAAILEKMGIKKGDILNHNQLAEGRMAVEEFYKDNGYILARFTDINISEERILNLKINEGYLNEIIIEGNEKTGDYVILREFNVEKGQVLNVQELQKSFQKLLQLNYFEEFNPLLEVSDVEENTVNLVLELKEAKTGNFGAGVTLSSLDGWLGYLDIQERNLFGNAQTLRFRWEFGGVNNYSLSFQEPWLFGTPTSFGINLYDRKVERDDDKIHRKGGSISLGRKLTEEWNGLIRFKVEDSTTNWDSGDYDLVRSLTLQTSRDTTNNFFNPTSGSIDTFSVEYAGQMLGGDSNFTKYNLDLRRFYPGFRDEHAWGLRLKTGVAEGELPDLEKYRLGGSESLRGYESGKFTGRDQLLLNVEYRFPIVEKIVGVLFADGGNTWENHDEIKLNELHYSIGAGLRMNTPIGQIRLDYGFNEQGQGQPHFSLGHAF